MPSKNEFFIDLIVFGQANFSRNKNAVIDLYSCNICEFEWYNFIFTYSSQTNTVNLKNILSEFKILFSSRFI